MLPQNKNITNSRVFLKQFRLFKQLKVKQFYKRIQLEINKKNPFLLSVGWMKILQIEQSENIFHLKEVKENTSQSKQSKAKTTKENKQKTNTRPSN